MTLEQIKAQFSQDLNTQQLHLKELQQTYKAQGREDEAKFAVIEANVVDIFSKMFVLSCEKAQKASDWRSVLAESYSEFFVKIPGPWSERLAQCEAFNLTDEAHIERLKLNCAQRILAAFNTLLAEAN